MAAPIHIPTNSVLGFLFSTREPTFVSCNLSDDSDSGSYEAAPHCGFDLHLPSDCNIISHCISSLEKYPFRSSALFLTRLFGLFFYFAIEFYGFLAPHQIFDLEIFSLNQKVAFSF